MTLKSTLLLFAGSLALLTPNKGFSQKLYTTSPSGHAVIMYNAATNTVTQVAPFNTVNIAQPIGPLLHTGNGVLYGLANNSSNLYGAIYKTDTTSGTVSTLYQFTNNNRSVSGLTLANNGKLYTLAATSTSNTTGIYSFDTTSLAYTKEYEIIGNTGSGQAAVLLKASNGLLYGVVRAGGANNMGILFSFNPSNNAYTSLYDFNTANGTNPNAGLIQASNGKLYGVTAYGGVNDKGVIYSYDIASNTYTKLYDFVQSGGESPSAPLMQASNGLLYGTTMTGGSNFQGVIYSFDLSSNTYTKLHDFFANGGYGPRTALTQASNGLLYGTANQGGTNFKGVIFSYDISTSTYTKLLDGDNTTAGNFTSPFLSFETAPTGIKENSNNAFNFSVYPNPCAASFINIRSDKKVAAFQIINSLGQLVKSGLCEENKISVTDLNAGVYTLIICDKNLQKSHSLFIKN